MAAFTDDLIALLRQRQTVDVDYVVEHARENLDHLAEFVPVEVRVIAERRRDELGEIDRAQQARAVGGQRLLAARVGGANVLAPPIVVHLVDAIDEHEAGLGEIVRGRHDDVPHAARGKRAVHAASDETTLVGDVVVFRRPFAPNDLLDVVEVDVLFLRFALRERKRELPRQIGPHGLHELVRDQ